MKGRKNHFASATIAHSPCLRRFLLPFAAMLLLVLSARGQEEIDKPPINYGSAVPRNRVTRLMEDLKSRGETLASEPEFGHLRALLAGLEVPVASQTLVFSKTSLQRDRISPATPRALYFNDDTYVGFCRDGEVLEIATTDDQLGAVFYTFNQRGGEPRLMRQTENCLSCHASSPTRGVPGFLIRSVFTNAEGLPILTAKTYRTDPTSPLSERWGGWYVTGTHGEQRHLGNLVVRDGEDPDLIGNEAGQNRADLRGLVDPALYPEPGSDIVALMVLEQQVAVHNAITRAGYGTRQALHYESELNRELGKPPGERWESTSHRITSVCEPLVESLLFSGEAALSHEIRGTSAFAAEFAKAGPRDAKGRSLRELDLKRRMFKYPCSYLIYSSSFAALPAEARDYALRRIGEILDGRAEPKFGHLSAEDRTAVREILEETLPMFAAARGQ